MFIWWNSKKKRKIPRRFIYICKLFHKSKFTRIKKWILKWNSSHSKMKRNVRGKKLNTKSFLFLLFVRNAHTFFFKRTNDKSVKFFFYFISSFKLEFFLFVFFFLKTKFTNWSCLYREGELLILLIKYK